MVATVVMVKAAASAVEDDDWRLLRAYPPTYVARRLGAGEAIAVDGSLDDAAWARCRSWRSRS